MAAYLPGVDLPNQTAAWAMDAFNGSSTPYYWGPPDALVDWCELNFVHTPYVAEFYNTMTHVPAAMYCVTAAILMSIPSWTHAYSHADGHSMRGKPLESRFQMTLLGLAFVCVGSALFHATLRYWAQLLDEIPMLFVVGSLVYCLNRRRGSPRAVLFNIALASSLALIITVSVALYVYRKQYVLFVGCYIVGTLGLIIQSIALAVSGAGLDITQDPVGVQYRRKLLTRSVACYVFAGACWVVERLTCPHQKAPIAICAGTLDALGMSPLSAFCFFVPYLHAVWHVGSVLGAYELILFLALATGDNRTNRTVTRCKVTYMGLVA